MVNVQSRSALNTWPSTPHAGKSVTVQPFLYRVQLPIPCEVDLQWGHRYAVALNREKICSLSGILRGPCRTHPIYCLAAWGFIFYYGFRFMPAPQPRNLQALQLI